MAVVMHGTCSECYQTMDLILEKRQKEIVCPSCGHAVPALEAKVMDSIAKDQGKRRVLTVLAMLLFLLAAGLFLGFIVKAEPPPSQSWAGLPGVAKALFGGAVLSLVLSLAVGFAASSRTYVCEF
jgi:hypothetical protein